MPIIVTIKNGDHTIIYSFKHKFIKYWHCILENRKKGYEIEVTKDE